MSLESGLSGQVGYLAIAGILKDLFKRRATGVLFLSSGKIEKRVYFRNGTVIYASSNTRNDRLGDVLLAKGLITGEQYETSQRQVRETGKKHGTVLVQMGALSPKDLFKGLGVQIRSIVLSLFAWDGGTWRFEDSLPAREEIVSLRIPPAALILDGVDREAAKGGRFAKEWDFRALKTSIQPDPHWVLDDLDLPPESARIVALVGKGSPVEEIPSLVGLSEEKTAAHLYTLCTLEILDASERPAAKETAAPAGEERAAPETNFPSREKILGLAERIGRFNLYQVLRLDPSVRGDAIKSSYLALAKEFHPDRFFDASYSDIRDSVTKIFMRINEAYSTLSSVKKRAEYDRREISFASSQREKSDPEGDSRIAREQYLKGMKSLKEGDSWSAVESLRWAVQLSPRSASYHSWLGAALTSTRKRLHEAEQHCKTAITLDYSNPLYYVHLGRVYKTGKLLQKARKQFETALRLDAAFAEAREELENLEGEDQDKGFLDKIFKK